LLPVEDSDLEGLEKAEEADDDDGNAEGQDEDQ
jgi:hypothetical protein